MSPDELFEYGWRLADEALASGEWPPPTDEQLDRVAALLRGDLQRLRATKPSDGRVGQGSAGSGMAARGAARQAHKEIARPSGRRPGDLVDSQQEG